MRLGKFIISRDLIDIHPNDVIEVFYQKKVLPVRAEYLYPSNVEYTALCPEFDEVHPSEIPPYYQFIAHKEGSVITFTIEKL